MRPRWRDFPGRVLAAAMLSPIRTPAADRLLVAQALVEPARLPAVDAAPAPHSEPVEVLAGG